MFDAKGDRSWRSLERRLRVYKPARFGNPDTLLHSVGSSGLATWQGAFLGTQVDG